MRTAEVSAHTRPAWPVRAGLLAALFLCVWVSFGPALAADFVAWDDDHNFLENPAYRGLSGAHVAWMITTRHMGHYQPLSWLTLGLDHALWGMDARGYHATNILLHALVALVFFALARTVLALSPGAGSAATGRELDGAAAFATVLFALHPLRVESVAWVTERRDVLSALFLVSSLRAYLLQATRTGAQRTRQRVWSLVLYALSLLAKASGVVLPAVLLALDAWPLARVRREPWPRLVLEKWPYLTLALLFTALGVWAAGYREATLVSLQEHGLLARLVQAASGVWFYVGRTLWPAQLVPLHELPLPFPSLAPRWLVPAAGTVLVTLVLFRRRERSRGLWTAWLVFLVVLAPVSGLLQSGPQRVADRYAYLACMPFAVLAGTGLLHGMLRVTPRPSLALEVSGGFVLLLAGLTWNQTRVWHDSETLWSHAVRLAPEDPTALQNLGVERLRAGQEAHDHATQVRLLGEALDLFERGHALAPRGEFLVNQGLVHWQLAKLEPERAGEHRTRARGLLASGLALPPTAGGVTPRARLQLGRVLVELGQYEPAAAQLFDAVRAAPEDPEARGLLGIALGSLGRWDDARAELEHALALGPEDAKLWLLLGLARKELGRADDAHQAFARVCALRERALGPAAASDPDFVRARKELEASEAR